jgi:hypothetical protein
MQVLIELTRRLSEERSYVNTFLKIFLRNRINIVSHADEFVGKCCELSDSRFAKILELTKSFQRLSTRNYRSAEKYFCDREKTRTLESSEIGSEKVRWKTSGRGGEI